MIEDISKSVKASLYDRASSPLFGAFFVSWLVWNYKVILIVFSSMSADKKIAFIESNIYGADWSLLLVGLVYPLVSALIFIVVYPYPAKWIYKYWHSQQKGLKLIKQQIEDEIPLTVEESRRLRRDYLRLENQYDDELARQKSEIDRLKGIIATQENELANQSAESVEKEVKPKEQNEPNIDDTLSEEQKQVLIEIGNKGGEVENNDYILQSKLGELKVKYSLEVLESKGYLTSKFKVNRGMVSSLTTKGKKLAIELSDVG